MFLKNYRRNVPNRTCKVHCTFYIKTVLFVQYSKFVYVSFSLFFSFPWDPILIEFWCPFPEGFKMKYVKFKTTCSKYIEPAKISAKFVKLIKNYPRKASSS